jgi:hypothetical protein
MDVNEQLTDWSHQWVLLGHSIVCVGCMAAQTAHEAQRPFMHFVGCRHIESASRHPWRELGEIIQEVASPA